MNFLVLGGGTCQLNLIKKLKERGHTVVVSDYLEDAPGKIYADYSTLTSTFDIEGNIKIVKDYSIDAVVTAGTDQPVYTGVLVSEKTGLNTFISSKLAKAVTNKKIMKEIFTENHIPTVKYTFITKDFKDEELDGFEFPVVIKPFDSQGQRGVLKLNSIEEVRQNIETTFNYTKEREILLEEFYESEEITVSGWVVDKKPYVITITDRETYANYPHIGICIAHTFPTKYFNEYSEEIINISHKIVEAFNIKQGPIYFQMLIGKKGVLVNEIALRIGGAFEDEFIPYVTDIDILDLLINDTLNKKYDVTSLEDYNIYNIKKHISVQLFFAKLGIIKYMTNMKELIDKNLILNGTYNFKINDEIKEIKNATQRAGYMIIEGRTRQELMANIDKVYEHIEILDKNKNNLIIPYQNYNK